MINTNTVITKKEDGNYEVKGDFKITDNFSDIINHITEKHGKERYSIKILDNLDKVLIVVTGPPIGI